VFLHQDLTVTSSMWHNEDVVFDNVTPEWQEFCHTVLNFRVPMISILLCRQGHEW